MQHKFSKLNADLFQDESIKKNTLDKFVGGGEEGLTLTGSVTYTSSGGWDGGPDLDSD